MTQEMTFIPPPLPDRETPPMTWEIVRTKRDQMLLFAESQYNFDTPESIKVLWRDFKQALRDIPSTYADDINAIVWPEIPNTQQQLTPSGR